MLAYAGAVIFLDKAKAAKKSENNNKQIFVFLYNNSEGENKEKNMFIEINPITILIGVAILVLALKICKSLISKIIMAAVSVYVIFGESLNIPSITDIVDELITKLF